MRNNLSLRLLLAERDEEIKKLKRELGEEKEASIRMYNMYVEKDNIINEIKDYFEDLEIFAPSRDIKYDILDIIEGSDKE